MRQLSLSVRIYIGLVLTLAILGAIGVLLPAYQALMPTQELPASRPVLALANAGLLLVIYGGLGYLGYLLSLKIGFADIWDPHVSNRQRFIIPLLIGVGCGLFLIIADSIFSRFHDLGPLPHPQFPLSLVASATAGIGEEIVFRLFFVSFWTWLVSRIILKGKGLNPTFWVVAVLSALAFAFGHIPSLMAFFEFTSIGEIPTALLIEIILLNGLISIFAACFFRRFGFLAPVGIHFWTDIVWHVVWGLI